MNTVLASSDRSCCLLAVSCSDQGVDRPEARQMQLYWLPIVCWHMAQHVPGGFRFLEIVGVDLEHQCRGEW